MLLINTEIDVDTPWGKSTQRSALNVRNAELTLLLSHKLCCNSWFLTATSCCPSSGLRSSGQPSHPTMHSTVWGVPEVEEPQLQSLFFRAGQISILKIPCHLDTSNFFFILFYLGTQEISRRWQFSQLACWQLPFKSFNHMHPDNRITVRYLKRTI